MADRLVGLVWPGPDPSEAPIAASARGFWQQTGGAGSLVIETGLERRRATVARDPKRPRCGGHRKAIRRAADGPQARYPLESWILL